MKNNKIIRNIGSNLLLQVVTIIYGFILPSIIIDNYGSNVNGLISSITQFLAYITLLESGFGPVLKSVLYKPLSQKNYKEVANIIKASEKFFRTIAKIFIVYIIALTFLYPCIVNSDFSLLYTVSLIIIISISTLSEYYFGATYSLLLNADQKVYVISLAQTVTYLINIVVIVICAKFNLSIHLIKLISGIIFVLRPIYLNLYVKKKYNLNFEDVDDNYIIKNKWKGLSQHIASVIHSNTDVTVLTLFCSLSEVSVYTVYYLVVKGVKSLVQSFSTGIDSSFGELIAREEHKELNDKFDFYETIYYTISTLLFSCTIVLITPFISVYTNNVSDVNYIRPMFGYILVISEFIWTIRLIYNDLTKAAGHFKETELGSWIECIVNLATSIMLVKAYGIIGVAIGTLIAMTIRTCELIYHSNRYILKRTFFCTLKKVLLIVIETVLIFTICSFIPFLEYTSYITWLINAVIVFLISTMIIGICSLFFYKKQLMILKQKIFKSHI